MKTIGLLGGMGSYATCEIFRRLLDAFPAEKEWERPRILIDNNCTMPSRVRAILYGEREAQLIREMTDSVEHLVAAGAELIMLGCMTAHYFRRELPHRNQIIDVLEETRRQMTDSCRLGTRISCLCTEGSVQTGIWDRALAGFPIIYPDEEGMLQLREFIEIVKQCRVTKDVQERFARYVEEQPGQLVLLGCTELPVLLDGIPVEKETVDPIDCAIQCLKEKCLE